MNWSASGFTVKCFERFNGLDTALYKNIPSPFLFQPKLAQRGSGQVSMKDIDKIDELVKTMDGIKDSAASSGGKWDSTIDKLQDDLDRLKPDDDKKE